MFSSLKLRNGSQFELVVTAITREKKSSILSWMWANLNLCVFKDFFFKYRMANY